MKFVRYEDNDGHPHCGLLQPDARIEAVVGDVFSGFERTGREAQPRRLLTPIAPRQVVCIGLNYRQHAHESGMALPPHPVVFMKGINAVQNPGQPIRLPRTLASTEVDYEGELAVVIGRDCRNASRHEALDYVLGYTCANDVSARDWQLRGGGGQWWRGKSFDTFCPLGPVLVSADEVPNPNALRLRTRVNAEVVQDANTSDMIFDVAQLIAFLSGSTTLPAGTVILTGTPAGVGMARKPPRWLQPGDVVAIEIEGVGTLENTVEGEAGHA